MAPSHILLPYNYKTLLLVLLVGAAATCSAFVVYPQTSRRAIVQSQTSRTWSRHEALPLLQEGDGGGGDGVGEGSDGLIRWMGTTTSSHLWISDDITTPASILEGLRTALIGVTVIIFFLAGFAYFTAAILIPKAAEQLELECKELAPDLWDEYAAKLGPGETLATRPDLLQELGNKITPLIERKIMQEQQQQGRGGGGFGGGGSADATSSSSPPPLQVIESEVVSSQSSSSRPTTTTSSVLDAEVVQDENTDTKKT